MVSYEHQKALQCLIVDYWTVWVQSKEEELPDWFYLVLDFMEVACRKRFSVVTGFWEDA